MLEGTTRFLELTHLRQRLRALRFQPLPESAWQAANTLFCALSRAGLEGMHLPTLCDDRLLLDQDGTTTSLRIYRMVQALGLFDTFSWSKRRQRFLDGGQLMVGLTRRARFATLVNASATLGAEPDSAATAYEVPCLLAYDDALGWCLLASPQGSLPVGCPIQLRTRKIDVVSRLCRVRAITPHFMLFELDEMSPRLGSPAYPSSPRRHRHSRVVLTSQIINATEPNDEPQRRRQLRNRP